MSKHTRSKRSSERGFAKRLVIGGLVCCAVELAGCVTRTEHRCPFGRANADVEDEELDGMLDDAPATKLRLAVIDYECGFDVE